MLNSRKMKSKSIVLLLGLCSLAAETQVRSDKPSGNDLSKHHFKSGLGFSYEVPSNLKVISSKPFEAATKDLAVQQAQTAQDMKSISCNQPLLVAENTDESRIIQFFATAQGCATGIVTQKNVGDFGKYGTAQLSKHFALTMPEYGRFKVGSYDVWVMKSAMTPNPPNNPNSEIAVIVTYTPQAVIQCMVFARTPADLQAIVATHLKFDDGSETELVPSSAFDAQ